MKFNYTLRPTKRILALIFLFCGILAKYNAQTTILSTHQHDVQSTGHGCIIDLLIQQKKASNSAFAERHLAMDRNIRDGVADGERTLITIPVVVHIIHDNGPELISYEQILQGIEHLNLAFSNSGAYASPDGVDTQIQFCLAKQDPQGLYTTGYTITQSPLTEVIAETQDDQLKSIVQWDPNRYLNIWLVREISSLSMGDGISGYAFFPSSQGQPEDGIVNEASLFGSTYDNSKVHIHEAGHYLGLYHTFEGGCVNSDCMEDGDHVCDTPPDNSTAAVMCNSAPNTCSSDSDDASPNNPFRAVNLGGLGDQPDMIQNYMDYGYQFCQTHFSEGQGQRMQAVMQSERLVLQSSIACTSPCPYQMNVAIQVDTNYIEVENTLDFIVNAPGAIAYNWLVNGISVGNFDIMTYTFHNPGVYRVEVETSYDLTECSAITSVLIEVVCTAQAHFTMEPLNTLEIETEVSTINTSTSATAYEWYLDGQSVTTDAVWTETFYNAGSHRIYMVASNETCSDTSQTIFFSVGNCNYSRVAANWSLAGMNIFFPESGDPYVSGYCPIATDSLWLECVSTISDAEGQLLFFTDGIKVWDKNNILMPNGTGLKGHWSSTQSVLIVPHPGNTNQYYIFTTDAVENYFVNGTRYSVVDMTLNGGMGDIIESSKNTLLFSNGTEKLTATWHADGHGVWVASARRLSNQYFAFLIDGDGLHPDPVISMLGTSNASDLGSMVFSHDGNRMAAATLASWPWRILVTDFNPSTGVFSNDFEILLSEFENEQIYGLQFSPDNSKLYTTEIQGGKLVQYDLSLTTPMQVAASKYVVTNFPYGYGHIKLGINGVIYIPNFIELTLDAIQYPNLAGPSCGFQPHALSLGANSSGSPWVLPNMLMGYDQPHNPAITGPLNICTGENEYEYSIQFLSSEDVTIWSHSGPSSFLVSENVCALITGDDTATDTLSVILHGGCGITYDTIVVHTNFPGPDPLADELYYCNSSITLDPGDGYLSYYWMNSSNTQLYEVVEPGEYWVELTETTGCGIRDTVQVSAYPSLPALSLGPDVTICQGGLATLQPSSVYPHYQWQNGMTTQTITAFTPGLYWLHVTDGCAFTDSDTIYVSMSIPELDLNYNGEDSLCNDLLPLNIMAPGGFSIYEWSNGDSGGTTTLTTQGTFELTATTAAGCFATDTLWVLTCTSIQQFDQSNIIIYPNPASTFLHIDFGTGNDVSFCILNALGQVVYSSDENQAGETTIDTTSWADGMYTLSTRNNPNIRSTRFIVLK